MRFAERSLAIIVSIKGFRAVAVAMIILFPIPGK